MMFTHTVNCIESQILWFPLSLFRKRMMVMKKGVFGGGKGVIALQLLFGI